MHTILLTPQDTLFFRDARPMSGSLAGHTAYWPLPNIFNHALRSAFHRAALGSHAHRNGVSGQYGDIRDQKYGSLVTIGPFPVSPTGEWHLPTPADLVKDGIGDDAIKIGFRPVQMDRSKNPSSLPEPLTYALGATTPPSKDGQLPAWISAADYQKYLAGAMPATTDFKKHTDIGDIEAHIGIGIDPGTQAQDGERIYSAHYLRLQEGWRLGGLAQADDKDEGDLMKQLLDRENKIVIGGQQGVCSIDKLDDEQSCPLLHLASDISYSSRFLKWILLAPAVFPEIAADASRNIRQHPGGWLPNWIDTENGKVLLRETVERTQGESRSNWRDRVRGAGEINATLIAARIPGTVEISGWSLDDGAKPTQLAVPAGAVYYFECADVDVAHKLAAALNFPNRRSTLFGEKGFGVGVCAPVAESQIAN